MIKKMLAATVLVFGLGVNVASAQEVISGPKDYEKLLVTHAALCSGVDDMKTFTATNGYLTVFSGSNDITKLGKSKDGKPSESYADILYSDTLKSVVTIVYDQKANVACILSGIKNTDINEAGLNKTLGYKVSE